MDELWMSYSPLSDSASLFWMRGNECYYEVYWFPKAILVVCVNQCRGARPVIEIL